jgi:hypothetical protein
VPSACELDGNPQCKRLSLSVGAVENEFTISIGETEILTATAARNGQSCTEIAFGEESITSSCATVGTITVSSGECDGGPEDDSCCSDDVGLGSCCECPGAVAGGLFFWTLTTPALQYFWNFLEQGQANAFKGTIDAWIAGLKAALENNGYTNVQVGETSIIGATPRWAVIPATVSWECCGSPCETPIYEWDPEDFSDIDGLSARGNGLSLPGITFYECTNDGAVCTDNVTQEECGGDFRPQLSCDSPCFGEENPCP